MQSRLVALFSLFAVSCFPPNYWKLPSTGESIKVKKVMSTRLVCNSDKSSCSWIRVGKNTSVYAVEDRGFYINTAFCNKEGKAVITMWEELKFEDGTKCPVKEMYIKSIDDFAKPSE